MSDSKLYVIELCEPIGPLVAMSRLTRCKECRHAYEHHDAHGRWLMCEMSTLPEVKPGDFCVWGATEEDYSDEREEAGAPH